MRRFGLFDLVLLLFHLGWLSDNWRVYAAGEQQSCDAIFTSENAYKGTVRSPERYRPNTKCMYQLIAAPGKIVEISWNFLDLGYKNSFGTCQDDYLELSIFDDTRHKNKIRYCGKAAPEKLITMSQKVDILFQTSDRRRYSGFSANFSFIPEELVEPPQNKWGTFGLTDYDSSRSCGGWITDGLSGSIFHPTQPTNFTEFETFECYWLVRLPPEHRIYATIVTFEAEVNDTRLCKEASIEMADGWENPFGIDGLPPTKWNRFCPFKAEETTSIGLDTLTAKNRLLIRFTSQLPFSENLNFKIVWTKGTNAEKKKCPNDNDFMCTSSNIDKSLCIDSSLVCDSNPNCPKSAQNDESSATCDGKYSTVAWNSQIAPTSQRTNSLQRRNNAKMAKLFSVGIWVILAAILGTIFFAFFIGGLVFYLTKKRRRSRNAAEYEPVLTNGTEKR